MNLTNQIQPSLPYTITICCVLYWEEHKSTAVQEKQILAQPIHTGRGTMHKYKYEEQQLHYTKLM